MEEMTLEDLFYAGESAQINREFESAYYYFSKAIMLQPTNPETHQKLGIAKIENRDYRSALNDFNNAITFGGENWAYSYDMGLIYYELGDFNRSVSEYRTALKLIEDCPEDKGRQLYQLLDRLAKAQFKQGNVKGTIETLSQIIDIYEGSKYGAQYVFDRAQAKKHIGLFEEAIIDYNLAIFYYKKWSSRKDKEIQNIESIIGAIKFGQ